jgi:transcriptional regulator with XRE-family HTH domain
MTQPADAEVTRDLRMFGRNLCAARERVSPDQHAFAKLANLDRSTISKVECGKQAPKFDTFLILALAAQATPAELLSGVGLARVPPEAPNHVDATRRTPAGLFGANLKWARGLAGVSHEELGSRAKADRSLISDWELGKREANLRTILKLARALEIPAALLLHGVEPS